MSDLTNVCLYESIFELLTLRVFLIYTVLLGLEDRIQLNDGNEIKIGLWLTNF